MIVIAVMVILIWVVWAVLSIGDDLSGWMDLRDRYRKWARLHHKNLYLRVIVAGLVVYALFAFHSARQVANAGAIVAGSLAYQLVSQALKVWPLVLLCAAGCALVAHHRSRRRYMRGEPSDRRGSARAALLHLAGDAVADALPSLRAKGEGMSPKVGTVEFFTVTVGGRTRDYGIRVRLHMAHGMTIADLRKHTSDGLDPEHDRLATYVASSLRNMVDARGTEARQLLAGTGGSVPVFPYTSLSPVRTTEGDINPGRSDLLLLRVNPLTEVFHYPKVRPKLRHLGDPILVGVTIEAGEARATIRESHTSIWGQNRMGKTFYALNLGIGASQCRNVAFVVIDLKGPGGDLTALRARAAEVVTNPVDAATTLRWLVDEVERRSNATTTPGKLRKFSAALPEIVVFLDEWHELDGQGEAIEDIERLVRKAATFGVYLVACDQILSATQVPTRVTGQFHNVVSVRLGNQSHTGMVFPPKTFTGANGPHHIPPSWKGVAYGRFGEHSEIAMIRSLLSGPDVAAHWAKVDADAGLNVPLPDLTETLRQHRSVPVPVAVGAVTVGEPPPAVLEAVEACCAELGQPVPERLTPTVLKSLSANARSRVQNRKGATVDEKAVIDDHREVIRQHLHPDT